MPVVADSSPLIYLAALSDFQFLRQLFGSILIPEGVYREVVEQAEGFPVRDEVEAALDDWLKVERVLNRERIAKVGAEARLEAGESEAIVLAEEQHAEWLLMDDQRAVTYARRLGIAVTRTPIIYGEARLRGWIPSVR
jgi:predicted nucleic acid-binding protein